MSRLAEALNPKAFGGSTYEPKKDAVRLSRQLQQVLALMHDGQWRSPAEFEAALGVSWASIGARCRDLRKEEFGGYIVDRRRFHGGVHKYRLRAK